MSNRREMRMKRMAKRKIKSLMKPRMSQRSNNGLVSLKRTENYHILSLYEFSRNKKLTES